MRETTDQFVERAETAFENGDLDRAEELLRKALVSGPPTARLLGDMGVLHHARGDGDTARRWLESALELEPSDVVLRNNLAALAPQEIEETVLSSCERRPTWSLVVPSYDRDDLVRSLLDHLSRQTHPANDFEVIVVDDGSPRRIADACAGVRPPFAAKILRRANGGPGAARNTGIRSARGEYVLILNDDGIPEPDLIAQHVAAHAKLDRDAAVIGSFPYSEAARRRPFVRCAEKTGVIFGYTDMKPDTWNDWWSFWTCNISLRADYLRAVCGFDELFDDPMHEDIELGWRLQRDCRLRVWYHPAAVCHHDHAIDVDGFLRRQRLFGRNSYRLFHKYRNSGMLSLGMPGILCLGIMGPYDDRFFDNVRHRVEETQETARRAVAELRAWDETGERLQGADHESYVARMQDDTFIRITEGITTHYFLEGLVAGFSGRRYIRTRHDAADPTPPLRVPLDCGRLPDEAGDRVLIHDGTPPAAADMAVACRHLDAWDDIAVVMPGDGSGAPGEHSWVDAANGDWILARREVLPREWDPTTLADELSADCAANGLRLRRIEELGQPETSLTSTASSGNSPVSSLL